MPSFKISWSFVVYLDFNKLIDRGDVVTYPTWAVCLHSMSASTCFFEQYACLPTWAVGLPPLPEQYACPPYLSIMPAYPMSPHTWAVCLPPLPEQYACLPNESPYLSSMLPPLPEQYTCLPFLVDEPDDICDCDRRWCVPQGATVRQTAAVALHWRLCDASNEVFL